ncbi:MAG: DUF2783 domain-containing protein [Steroidobacteraceae bacterium]
MPVALRVTNGFAGNGDEFYAALLSAHEGLSDRQSAMLHTCLVLLLSNHIGELTVLEEALAIGRAGVLRKQETP